MIPLLLKQQAQVAVLWYVLARYLFLVGGGGDEYVLSVSDSDPGCWESEK